jgi:hypothetical protein
MFKFGIACPAGLTSEPSQIDHVVHIGNILCAASGTNAALQGWSDPRSSARLSQSDPSLALFRNTLRNARHFMYPSIKPFALFIIHQKYLGDSYHKVIIVSSSGTRDKKANPANKTTRPCAPEEMQINLFVFTVASLFPPLSTVLNHSQPSFPATKTRQQNQQISAIPCKFCSRSASSPCIRAVGGNDDGVRPDTEIR